MHFETDLVDFSSYKLSELDWEILEGLESVLLVSYPLDPRPRTGTHRSRFLTVFSKVYHPSQCRSYHVQSPISRCS
jgi:hypothetical protein